MTNKKLAKLFPKTYNGIRFIMIPPNSPTQKALMKNGNHDLIAAYDQYRHMIGTVGIVSEPLQGDESSLFNLVFTPSDRTHRQYPFAGETIPEALSQFAKDYKDHTEGWVKF